MTLALTGARREAGVSVVEVNLTFIWDVISQIKVGERGRAYVIDEQSRLIAHPDISLVLSNSDLGHLAQVRAARAPASEPAPEFEPVKDIQGDRVLSAYAAVPTLGWLVFVELPVAEAYAPIYATIRRSGALLAAALALAVLASILLARRMVAPIQALRTGAERIGSGDLAQRISIRSGDEFEALGDQFNNMALRLEESTPRLSARSKSARTNSNWPIWQGPAFSLSQLMIYGSRSTPWVYSLRSCETDWTRGSETISSSALTQLSPQ